MVGKDATATNFTLKQPQPVLRLFAAPMTTLLIGVLGSLFALESTRSALAQSHGAPPAQATSRLAVSPIPLEVRSQAVHHWPLAGTEAYWMRGGCVLRHGTNVLQADEVLLLIDGPPGQILTRLAMRGVRDAAGNAMPNAQTAVLLTATMPELDAPRALGLPETPPELMKSIPPKPFAAPSAPPHTNVIQAMATNPAAHQMEFDPQSGPVRQVQFELPPAGGMTAPALQNTAPNNTNPNTGQIPNYGLDISTPRDTGAETIPPGIPSTAPQTPPRNLAPPQTLAQPGDSSTSPPPTNGASPDNSILTNPSVGLPPTNGLPGPINDGLVIVDQGVGSPQDEGWQFSFGGGSHYARIGPRNAASSFNIKNIGRPEIGEEVGLIRGGVTMEIRDVTAMSPNGFELALGNITLSADRIVVWGPSIQSVLNGTSMPNEAEGELYLEGDIVVRQGDRIIYADAMYYNVVRQTGMILDAEAITTLEGYNGVVRLKADVMQQVQSGQFIAFGAAVTSSRMGVPRYWLQSERLSVTDRRRLSTDMQTGEVREISDPYVSSRNNFVYIGGFPVLYWPRFGTSLKRRPTYLSSAKLKNDDIFGTQVMLEWDLFQLLGVDNVPEGVEWNLSTDYLSDRGPAFGTSSKFSMPTLFGVGGPIRGESDSWFIDDEGLDTLGNDRKNLQPETSLRGRSMLRARQSYGNGFELIGEVGYLSDRNFLEQYLENEWDQNADLVNGIRLRRAVGNRTWDLAANVRSSDFYMEDESLPEFTHAWIGASLLNDWLTWSEQSSIGYRTVNVADTPVNAVEQAKFTTLPGEINSSGIVASTRQEISMPMNIMGMKFIPFLSGDATHYGEAANGEDLTRLAGQAGLRTSLTMSRIDPTIQSALLNVRGLAQKTELRAEYFYADSNANLDELPYLDSLDDNAQEQFRRRFIFDTYGGTLPNVADPRNYALRQGLQRWVTSPSGAIVDDTQQLRLGLHNRFQTKRGLPGRERIVDLFQFDVDTVLFPNAAEDNFGETLGPTTYDLRYHIGDRVTLLSDGYFDFFDGGLRSISYGMRTSRPGVGDMYLGIMSLEGPISSTVLRSSFDYRMNEKWIASASTTYDFGSVGNVGQSFGITRIGESFLLQVGMNVDAGRDNVSFGFAIEPRFWPKNLGRLGGQMVLPPGVEGLE